MKAFLNGRIDDIEKILISPEDRGFVFADGAYEVIHTYNGKLFRYDDHVRRFKRSLSELQISSEKVNDLETISQKLLQANGLLKKEALLYFQITRGSAPRTHYFPKPEVPVTVYASISEFLPLDEKWTKGIAVVTVPDIRWHRCDIKSISLTPNVLNIQHARDNNADDALFIRDTVVTETTRASFFAVFEDTLRTHPENNCILSGVTRKVVIELCSPLNIPFVETPLTREQLKDCTEAFICGTGNEIMPVTIIDSVTIGSGKPGKITRKIQKAFFDLTHPTE